MSALKKPESERSKDDNAAISKFDKKLTPFKEQLKVYEQSKAAYLELKKSGRGIKELGSEEQRLKVERSKLVPKPYQEPNFKPDNLNLPKNNEKLSQVDPAIDDMKSTITELKSLVSQVTGAGAKVTSEFLVKFQDGVTQSTNSISDVKEIWIQEAVARMLNLIRINNKLSKDKQQMIG